MFTDRTTLTQYLIEERRRFPDSTGDFNGLILDVALACKAISRLVAQGALGGHHGASGQINVQGETQQKLDVLADNAFISSTQWGGHIAGLVSEELDDPYAVPDEYPRGKYLLVFDPLDGSSNIDVNVSVGSIFSVLRAPTTDRPPVAADFLQPGTAQVAAGYAVYGPSTMIVLTVGRGVHAFTLDQSVGEFFLTHENMRIPRAGKEFAINSSNSRFWEPAVSRYVAECLAGRVGPREKDFNMRWVASMVADAHRILTRGGIYLYPRDTKDPEVAGRLRLLYEANPMAWLIEQAGGVASTGRERILDVTPTDIHQRIGFIFGAADEVERIEAYHREHDENPDLATDSAQAYAGFDTPLYAMRGLYRTVR